MEASFEGHPPFTSNRSRMDGPRQDRHYNLMAMLPVPAAVLEFVAVICRKTCNISDLCSCYMNKLVCMDGCNCNCTTKSNESDNVDVENDSSNEDEILEDCSDEKIDEY